MTSEGLSYLNTSLDGLNLNYQFMEWTSPNIPSTYWVGEYVEVENLNEDGLDESTFILTGTTNGKHSDLESGKALVKGLFPNEGRTLILPSGSGIAVSYINSMPIPSIDEGVRRIQINLNIKEWRC